MSNSGTIKWPDFLMRQLQDLEVASLYLQASWEEEELIGLQRGIHDVMRAHQVMGDPAADSLENLEKLVALGLDTKIIEQLKAEVLHQQPLPQAV
jgi:hypothetical protein